MSLPQIPDLDGLMEAFDKISALTDLMAEAQAQAPDSVTVEDSTQSLELTMLNDGTIEDFHIESDWRDNIDPEDLGASITALIGDANTELLSASGTFLEENYEDWQEEQEEREFNSLTSPVVQQTRQDADEILERASGQMVPLDDSLAEAFSFVDDALAKARAFAAMNEGAASDEDHVGEEVWCERTAGIVTSVGVDPAWAAATPYPVLRSRIFDALVGQDGEDSDQESFARRGEAITEQLLGGLSRDVD